MIFGDFVNKKLLGKLIDFDEIHKLDRFIGAMVMGYALFIIPMVFVAILFPGYLYIPVFIHFVSSIVVLLYSIIQLLNNLSAIEFPKMDYNVEEKLLIFSIGGVIVVYTIILLVFYERGWDALHYYFPNALYYYGVEGIPSTINPLNFFPPYKPPLNTMYIVYSLYVTGGTQYLNFANIYPLTFIIGTGVIIYRIIEGYGYSRITALWGVLFFLALPIVYAMVYTYAYYQDLPVMFFMFASYYFMGKIKDSRYYLVMGSIAASLGILSKLSGFTIFLVIILVFNFRLIGYYLKALIIITLTVFLSMYTLHETYIGDTFVVIILGIILLYLIRNQRRKSVNSTKSLLNFVFFPMVVAGFWIWFMAKDPLVLRTILEYYFSIDMRSVNTSFTSVPIQEIYLENGSRVSFLASVLYIFTGSTMGLIWLFPKLYGLLVNSKLNSLRTYFLSYYMIWYAYYNAVSVRYLMPIIPAISIFTAIGLFELLRKLKMDSHEYVKTKLLFVIFGTLTIYPLLPLEYLYLEYSQRFYQYHKNQLLLLTYVFIISLLLFLIIKNHKFFEKLKFKLPWSTGRYGFVLILLLLTVSPLFYDFGISNYNVYAINEQYNYWHRKEYHELIDVINAENLANDDIIVGVNVPGLEYYTTRSVIDLMSISKNVDVSFLTEGDHQDIFNAMVNKSIVLIIGLNQSHPYYPIYIEKYASLSIYTILDEYPRIFRIEFYNNDFILYRRHSDFLGDI